MGRRPELPNFLGKDIVLTMSVVALILTRTTDQVLFYRFNYEYAYFVWYFSALILPFAYLCITWPIVWYLMAKTQQITPQMTQFPKYRLAIMGLLDTLYNLASTFPVQHIGGNLSNVLSQIVLPMNMILSYIFLRMRFRWNHYLGAVLVIGGVIIKMYPDLGHDSSGVGWIFMYIGSNVFNAASNTYKEIGLKDANLNEFYANAWIGFFQLIFGFLTCWTLALGPFVDPHPAVTSGSAISEFLTNANKCFLGQDVEIDNGFGYDTKNCSGSLQSATPLPHGCALSCTSDGAPVYLFMTYIVFNVAFNQFMLVVLKRGSSVLFVVSNAVRLPLVAALNSWALVAGPAQQSFVWQDGVALVVLILALISYYYRDEIKPPPGSLRTSEKDPLLGSQTQVQTYKPNARGNDSYSSV